MVHSLGLDAAQALFRPLAPLFPRPYNCKVDGVFVVENWPLQQYAF